MTRMKPWDEPFGSPDYEDPPQMPDWWLKSYLGDRDITITGCPADGYWWEARAAGRLECDGGEETLLDAHDSASKALHSAAIDAWDREVDGGPYPEP